MIRVVIGLGSNLGDRVETLRQAVKEVGQLPKTEVLRVSRLYETEPIGGPAQADYLNGVILINTSLAPEALLEALLEIEYRHGREHREHWGPRTLDLDIVDIEGFVSDTPTLTVPHPRAIEREFVLRPLADVATSWMLAGRSVALRLASMEDEAERPDVAITQLADEWWH